MAFGPESKNPRERRAYAHTKLLQLRQCQATYEDTFEAVWAATHNRKGRASGFAESLGKIAVVLVDWSVGGVPRPDIVHHNFGGYLMPREETDYWTDLRQASDPRYHEIHSYPMARFTRMFQAGSSRLEDVFPQPGAVLNPAEFADVTPLIAFDNDAAVAARITQLTSEGTLTL